jgi:aryl-alcohol dehydrogenase-like predicted oxidoreductase
MKQRNLGRSGLSVSVVMLGGNVFGWTADEAASFKLLDGFVAAGGNFIDTADVYSKWVPGHSGGESETIIGRWMTSRRNRNQVLVATKVGSEMGSAGKGLSRAYIQREVEDSLRRLQTDRIDLYQSHVDDPDTPMEETIGAYGDLVKQGKVRAIGASNFTAERLAQSLAVSAKGGYPRYESLQPMYNLFERAGYETALEPLCRAEDIGVIGYSSLGSGFLTGKYRSDADLDKSPRGQGVKKRYFNDRGFRVLAALDEVAKRYKTTPGAVAMAWLIARPGVTSPIASATNLEQLGELVASAQLTLDRDAVERLNQASA